MQIPKIALGDGFFVSDFKLLIWLGGFDKCSISSGYSADLDQLITVNKSANHPEVQHQI